MLRVKKTRAHSKTDKWLFGSIIEVKRPSNYVVKIGSERTLVHEITLLKFLRGQASLIHKN